MMRRPRDLPPNRRLLVFPLCVALGLACTEMPSEEGAGDAGTAGEAAIGVREGSPYGAHLVDAQGRSLYVFTADQHVPGSACLRACAEEWPPLVARGSPRLMDPALDPARVGTVRRTDGALQVTYAAWPLYRHRDDHAPGDVRRQEPRAFAGEWYLLSPEGETIEIDAASTSETPDVERSRPDTPRPVLHPERIARLAPSRARAGS